MVSRLIGINGSVGLQSLTRSVLLPVAVPYWLQQLLLPIKYDEFYFWFFSHHTGCEKFLHNIGTQEATSGGARAEWLLSRYIH